MEDLNVFTSKPANRIVNISIANPDPAKKIDLGVVLKAIDAKTVTAELITAPAIYLADTFESN